MIAVRVEKKTLSDDSVVFNVLYRMDEGGTIAFFATDKAHALALQSALSKCTGEEII
jgi:hypothetical protein